MESLCYSADKGSGDALDVSTSLTDRSGRPDKVMGQSIVLSEIKEEVPLENDDPANKNFLITTI